MVCESGVKRLADFLQLVKNSGVGIRLLAADGKIRVDVASSI